MKREKLREKIKSCVLLMMVIVVVAMFTVAGCTTKKINNDASGGSDKPSVDIATDKTKSAPEQNQDTLAHLLPDGVYESDETYGYHDGGSETISISITVKDDVIIDASVEGNDPHQVSDRFIRGVNDALPELVVGKRIDEVNLPKQISGSSLTTAAVKGYLDSLYQ